jgi:hypothetical protein
LVAAALAVGVVACSAPDAVPSSRSTTITAVMTTSTVAETTTTTAAETTTTAVETTTTSGGIPYPDTTGDDWFKIVTEIEAFGGWLFENPDEALLSQIVLPGSPWDTLLRSLVTEYVINGWRDLPDGRAQILEVTLQRESAGAVVLLVVSDFDGATTVDATGVVVEEQADTEPQARVWFLDQQDDGRWLIYDVVPIGPVGGVGG